MSQVREVAVKTLQPRPGVIAAHLSRQPVFSALGSADREALADEAGLRLYDRGEVLFEEGQPADRLFCVVHGAVRVARRGPGGRAKVIHLLEAPALVAEVPVFMGEVFPATTECVEPCTVLVLPRAALLAALRRNEELALHLLAAALIRLHELTRSLAAHGEKSGAARLASYLLGLGVAQGARVTLPAAKKDVACYLGMQPESFSRALAALKRDGLIEEEEQRISLLDRAGLERLLAEC